MPSVVVKLYSVFFKAFLKHKLLNSAASNSNKDGYAPVSRPAQGVPANASFLDGVATKDIHIDPHTSLSLRIFLPESALPQEQKTGLFEFISREVKDAKAAEYSAIEAKANIRSKELAVGQETWRSSYGGDTQRANTDAGGNRRYSHGGELLGGGRRVFTGKQDYVRLDLPGLLSEQGEQLSEALVDTDPELPQEASGPTDLPSFVDGSRPHYCGYVPDLASDNHKKLPIIVQFHGGAFVTGNKASSANDVFCRRMAKLCDAIVVAVDYRLAPEHKYPAAFDDGYDALSWLAKQANLADCSKSLGHVPSGFARNGSLIHRPDLHRELVDSFGGSTVVEPWLAAHGDPSRCVLLGVSSGGNIADFVARKAVQAGRLLEPVKVVAQVLMYPFFLGSVPTTSEYKLANSYFYDKAACILAWKLFLPDGEYTPDHPAANPLLIDREPPLKHMPPTLTVVGELDWMKDRAIAYSEALRKVNIDAPVLEYKDAVHEFATLDFLVKSRQAEACAEDMAIWIKKYISLKGHEFSY